MDIDKCRSYATREGLNRALAKNGFDKDRYLVVCNTKGRFTAIFPVSNFSGGGYLGRYSECGFMTLG